MRNLIREKLLNASKKSTTQNRGMYPHTLAMNVYKSDGSAIEENTTGPVYPEKPDVIVTPGDPENTVNNAIAELEAGKAMAISEGEVNEPLSINKAITLMGETAGIKQNFNQTI